MNGRPRLCLVGPMVGRNPGYVTTQGEKLSDLFAGAGYPVISVSSSTSRLVRLAEISATLLRERHRIDLLVVIVYSGRSFVVSDVASTIGKLHGIPMVMSLHGGNMPRFMARFPGWTRRVLSRGRAIVSQSEYLARTVAEHELASRIIPNVLALPAYPHRQRDTVRPRLFWMRAFHEAYHPELAIHALARVRARYPEATLVMAGQDKGLQAGCGRLARELGVAEAVRFPGFLELDGKLREGDAADIFLNTNRIDNRPLAVVEAAALGLPVVATAVGGIADLLTHEQTGLLVPDADPDAMAAEIVRLVEEPRLAARLSAHGRSLAERSAPGRVLSAWEEVFGDVLGGTRRWATQVEEARA